MSQPPITYEQNSWRAGGVSSCLSSEFQFKYVPKDKFNRIVSQVQKKKRKKQEHEEWLKYLEEKKGKEFKVVMGHQPEHHECLLQSKDIPEPQHPYPRTKQLLEWQQFPIQNNCTYEQQQNSFRDHNYYLETHQEMLQEYDKESLAKSFCNLQTIPEEDQPISPIRKCTILSNTSCPVSKKSTYNDANDCLITENSEQDFVHTDNLSAGPSKQKLYDGSRESIHYRRIQNLVKKMYATLDSIYYYIDKIPEPDGMQDLIRRQQRALEFSSRFCRNYVYPLQRQITDIRRQIKGLLSCAGARHTLHLALCQKMVTAHKIAGVGLQAYLQHMPSSVRNAIPEKLRILLWYVVELSQLNIKLGITVIGGVRDGQNEIERKCKALLIYIQQKGFDHKGDVCTSHLSVHRTIKNASQTSVNRTNLCMTASQASVYNVNKKVNRKEEALMNKLSMYANKLTVGKSKINWCKKSASLAKEKFGSPSKCIRNPVNLKTSIKDDVFNSKLKKQFEVPETSMSQPIKQNIHGGKTFKEVHQEINAIDDIKTMMDLIPPEHFEEEESISNITVLPQETQVCFDSRENGAGEPDGCEENPLVLELLKVAKEINRHINTNKKLPEAGDVLTSSAGSSKISCKYQSSCTELHAKCPSHFYSKNAEAAIHHLQDSVSKLKSKQIDQMKPEDIKTIIESMNYSLSLLTTNKLCNKDPTVPQKKSQVTCQHTGQNKEQYKKEAKNVKYVCISHGESTDCITSEEHEMFKNNKTAQCLINDGCLPQEKIDLDRQNTPKKFQKALISAPSEMLECSTKYQHNKQNLKRNRHVPLVRDNSTDSELPTNWEHNKDSKLYKQKFGASILIEHAHEKKIRNYCNDIEKKSKEKHISISKTNLKENHVVQNDIDSSIPHKKNQECGKIDSCKGALKGPPIHLKVTSPQAATVLNGRNKYCQHMSTKSLYSELKKPWLMISRFADQLVYNNLETVTTSDTGINNIAKKLLEFELE